jgi:hypothetical protein
MNTSEPKKDDRADDLVPQTEEERKFVELVKAGLASGPPIPVDDKFFQHLMKRIQPER